MAVQIAHASIDERGKISGGAAGDQTGKEVCIRAWYSKPWQYIIRCKNEAMREKIAHAMECACANNKIGYDQNQRNTLLTHARKVNYNPAKVTTKCETDCSALVSLACIYAGIPETTLVVNGNSATTSTLRSRLTSTKKFEVLASDKYTSAPDYLLRGDILLKEGSHVAVSINNGSKISSSTSSKIPNTDTSKPKSHKYTQKQFIKDVRSATGLTTAGIADSITLNKLVTVSKNKNSKHKIVIPIQKYLNSSGYNCGVVDGIYGSKTRNAVISFQKKNNLTADGIIGKNTWKKLLKIS